MGKGRGANANQAKQAIRALGYRFRKDRALVGFTPLPHKVPWELAPRHPAIYGLPLGPSFIMDLPASTATATEEAGRVYCVYPVSGNYAGRQRNLGPLVTMFLMADKSLALRVAVRDEKDQSWFPRFLPLHWFLLQCFPILAVIDFPLRIVARALFQHFEIQKLRLQDVSFLESQLSQRRYQAAKHAAMSFYILTMLGYMT